MTSQLSVPSAPRAFGKETTVGGYAPPDPAAAATRQARLTSYLSRSLIPSLDGIRAIAAFSVVFYHFGFDWVPGATGVTGFFVLSGFLITWLLLAESNRTGTVSFKGFYRRRSLRIFPAFYLYLLANVAINIVRDHPMGWSLTASAAAYVSNYYLALTPGHGDHFLGHTWSLAIEEQFYLLWPVAFWLMRRNLSRMTSLLAATIGCIWVYRAVLCVVYRANDSYLYHAFDTRADALLVGCLLAVLAFRGKLEPLLKYACSKAWQPVVTLAVLLLVIYTPLPEYFYRYTVGYALQPLVVAVLIIQCIYFSDHRGWGWLNSRVMRYLGRLSYPIYLWQQQTVFTARRVTESFPVVVQLAFAVLVTVAFAALSYHLVEVRFLKLRYKKATAPAPTAAHAAAGVAV
jgi:peptidoglycan/LPS O-acetylase OafA/YrhL